MNPYPKLLSLISEASEALEAQRRYRLDPESIDSQLSASELQTEVLAAVSTLGLHLFQHHDAILAEIKAQTAALATQLQAMERRALQ